MNTVTKRLWCGPLLLAGVLVVMPMLAFGAPPSAGTILQQTTRPRPLPTAPRGVIELPAPKQQSSQSSVAFKVEKVVIKGNTLVATNELTPLVAGLEGKTEHLSDLDAAARRITALYHQRGYPLAYAYLPAQKIKHGVVTIAVVEPKYDHINVKTQGHFSGAQAKQTLGLHAGQPVQQASLERGLLLLNQTPGIRVAGTLVPGTQAGTSSLDVNVKHTPLFRFGAGLDNYGSDATGRVRGHVEASLNNPFGHGGQIAANAMRTEAGLLQSEGLSVLSPDLWNGLRIGAYGSHVHYTLGGHFTALHETGQADQYGLYASMPLILAPGRILQLRLDVLRDRFGQSSAAVGFHDRSRLDLVKLTLAGSRADPSGVTSGGIVITHGHKAIGIAASRMADALGPNTAGNFWIGQLRLRRTQRLPKGFTLHAALSGQLASRNLDGSQKFYLGGPFGVMSYAVAEAGGDAGVLTRLGLFHDLPVPIPGNLSAGLLLQGGEVWLNHSAFPGATANNRAHLAGAGVELDYHFNRTVALQLDYVHHLGEANLPGGTRYDNEFWGSLDVHF